HPATAGGPQPADDPRFRPVDDEGAPNRVSYRSAFAPDSDEADDVEPGDTASESSAAPAKKRRRRRRKPSGGGGAGGEGGSAPAAE
ncbi:MAG: hypothetical protein ACLGH2_04815, partial [Gammaproteobacteria bacterium]